MIFPSSSLQNSTLTKSNAAPNLSSQKQQAKLQLLQEHDADRTWETLEDARTCLLCGSEFSGAQIRIHAKNGRPVFQCPETTCRGTLPHFVYAGNPLLSEATWLDWMKTT